MSYPLPSSIIQSIETEGFAILAQALDSNTINALLAEIQPTLTETGVRQRQSQTFAIRNLLNVIPSLRSLLEAPAIQGLAENLLGQPAPITRAIFFDKVPSANWKVAWHQDLTITVKAKQETFGFSKWSTKAGIPHAQAPLEVLQNILTLRLHLDDTYEANGALKVIPGTHKQGILTPNEIQDIAEQRPSVICQVPQGGILAMKPLLLHASLPALKPYHRRVIHLEFSAHPLPAGLEWYGS